MSKKIKPVFEDAVVEPVVVQAPTEETVSSQEDALDKATVEEPRKVGPKSLTKEMLKKLEEYDALVESNRVLLKEKDELTSKASEMVLELEKLRAESKDAVKLKNEIEQLQKTSDEYLIRISELTFENAKLTCQLQTLSATQDTQPVLEPKSLPKHETFAVRPDPYNPYLNNGYGGWN